MDGKFAYVRDLQNAKEYSGMFKLYFVKQKKDTLQQFNILFIS